MIFLTCMRFVYFVYSVHHSPPRMRARMTVTRKWNSESSSSSSLENLLHFCLFLFFFIFFYSLSASVLDDILWLCTRTHAQSTDSCFYQPHITLALAIIIVVLYSRTTLLACFYEWARLWLVALVAEPYIACWLDECEYTRTKFTLKYNIERENFSDNCKWHR